jgi:hypothetical protein
MLKLGKWSHESIIRNHFQKAELRAGHVAQWSGAFQT